MYTEKYQIEPDSSKLNMEGVGVFALLLVSYVCIHATRGPSSHRPGSTDATTANPVFVVTEGHVITIDEYLDDIDDDMLRNQTRHLLKICPDTDLCGIDLERDPPTQIGCCITCSCNDTCHTTQSCCPHVYTEIPSGISPETDMTCSYAEMSNEGAYYGEQYLFYTTCPDDSDPAQKAACERRWFAEEASFEDVVPVTDTRMKLNYINRHCAACHEILTEDLAVWKAHIECLQTSNDWSNLAKMVAQRDDCRVEFEPPDEVDVNTLRCVSASVFTCNVTGEWTTYDAVLETACQQYPLRYRVDMKYGQRVVYRNAFCALCNGVDIQRNIDFSECASGNVLNVFNLLVSVSLSAAHTREDGCSNDDIFDPIVGVCRSLDCTMPLLMLPGERVCSSAIEYISDALYSIPFKVTLSGETLYLQSLDVIGYFFLNSMDQSFNNGRLSSSVCDVHFFVKLSYPYASTPTLYETSPIVEMFVLANIYVQKSAPQKAFQRFVTEMTNSSSEISGTRLSISHGYVDGALQTPRVLSSTGGPTLMLQNPLLWIGLQTVTKVTLFEDPYDHTTVVGGIQNWYTSTCDTDIQLYDSGFIDCPVLVYDLGKTGMVRVPAGLMLREELIEFGQFRSLNDSHVAVCFDTMSSMLVWSGGNACGRMPWFALLFLVYVIVEAVHVFLY